MLPSEPTEIPIDLRSLAEAVPVARTRAAPASNSFFSMLFLHLPSPKLGSPATDRHSSESSGKPANSDRTSVQPWRGIWRELVTAIVGPMAVPGIGPIPRKLAM